ncbi:putative RNA-binding Zn ribbon-like protein [Saccharopolyspora erythraea NRRL 2338]|uniref:Uncharacterized protein n=2 Tax=Saccharopolyspora erythraea TaxID=1836 RepID=A4FFK6_SACEN|nr:CGNR zinc finger domain-containing protein [Saccharopolyspora erythraea]EQD81495.1 hypothetical protein N599_35900 [Saccharopolyspora erythraea D]PFG96553.1 putative RNA-binding Zn ribbon-like protein [Saccharopolyspora erythraea NRRL 2338]QRK93040.1 CGNR zinc finger domain-containing protein [Saccharopolyspora erythraea]CAM02831.1 hypothetical protein SACE_3557 [Saccharopolyspora erythraea NRRL 2338]
MPPGHGIRWSEHHQVPEARVVLFDFLNTLDERTFGGLTPYDELTSPAELAGWLSARDLVPPGTNADATDFRIALRLREVLRDCADANRTRESPPEDAMAELGRELPLRAVVGDDGGVGLRPVQDGVRGALARLLADAVRASIDGTWARIKMCAADNCRNVFYDHSKPRNGRWCASSGCGNRMKTRSYRRRRQERG